MSGPHRSVAVGDPACRGKPRRRLRYVLVLAGLALGIQLALGVAGAGAHQWNGWHWNRGGSGVSIYVWDQTGGC